MQEIAGLLELLGCSKAEANTFGTIVKADKGTSVVALTRSLNLPRATLYGHINTLINIGLVKKGRGDVGSLFYAESPEHIKQLFDERARQLLISKKHVHDVLSHAGKSDDSYRPKLFFFDQKNAGELILRDILRSGAKDMYWFWPMSDMLEGIPYDVFVDFHNERIRRGIRLHTLWPKNKAVDPKNYPELKLTEKEALRETRILPGSLHTVLGYGICGDKVGFISTKKEGYGFVLDSRELAATLKSQFDYWWKLSKPLK